MQEPSVLPGFRASGRRNGERTHRPFFLFRKPLADCPKTPEKHGGGVRDMASLSQQNHNGGRRDGVHSRSGSEPVGSTA